MKGLILWSLLHVFQLHLTTGAVYAKLGKTIALDCKPIERIPVPGFSFGIYSWFKELPTGRDNTVIKLDNNPRFQGVFSQKLVITNVQPDDEGTYRCVRIGKKFGLLKFKLTIQVDGQWGSWYDWNSCSVSCGGGQQTRRRVCNSPEPKHGGKECVGNGDENRTCSWSPCPINGQWGSWYIWDMCSVSCGGGQKTRRRECNNPRPSYGGKDCVGDDEESGTCSSNSFPIDGQWGNWYHWNRCSVSCGGGQQTRQRECNSPAPKNGGKQCVGDDEETRTCSSNSCPIAGEWGSWYHWNNCSMSCGGGQQTRHRECNSPEPKHGGKECVGDDDESRTCSSNSCPTRSKENTTVLVVVAASCGILLVLTLFLGLIIIAKQRKKFYLTVANRNVENLDIDERNHIYDEISSSYDTTDDAYVETTQNLRVVNNIHASNEGQQTSTGANNNHVYFEFSEEAIDYEEHKLAIISSPEEAIDNKEATMAVISSPEQSIDYEEPTMAIISLHEEAIDNKEPEMANTSSSKQSIDYEEHTMAIISSPKEAINNKEPEIANTSSSKQAIDYEEPKLAIISSPEEALDNEEAAVAIISSLEQAIDYEEPTLHQKKLKLMKNLDQPL